MRRDSASLVRSILICLMTGAMTGDALAQSLRTTGGRASLTQQNGLLNGQRSDLNFDIENVQFLSEPCPGDATKRILTGLRAEIKIEWVKAYNHFGSVTPQGEAKGMENGEDFFTIQWQGRNRWTRASMTRNGNSVFAGANPEATEGGNGTWDGVRVTPPSGFENAKPRTVTYVLEWSYNEPNGNNCKVVSLPIRGWYMHSYIDDYHILSDKAVSVSASFPWSVGISGTVSFTNEHSWTKQLVDPTGKSHTRTLEPPANYVPQASCCPQPVPEPDPDPTGDLDDNETDDEVDRGGQGKISVTGTHIESAVITARAPDSGRVITDSQLITIGQPCDVGCGFEAFISIPPDYTDPEIDVEVALFNVSGAMHILETTMTVLGPPTNPIVQIVPPNPDQRVGPGSMVQVFINDESPDADLATVAQRVQVLVMSEFYQPGQPTDQEGGPTLMLQQVGPGQFAMMFPMQPPLAGIGNPGNGVVEANDGDRIHIGYNDNDSPLDTVVLNFSAQQQSLPYFSAEAPTIGGVLPVGVSVGGLNQWALCDDVIDVPLPPAAPALQYANAVAQTANAACPDAVVSVGMDGRITGLGDLGPIGPLLLTPGLRLLMVPPCPGDIAGDTGTLGGDAMVSFGDFLALLGLVGPCPDGDPGCTGDIADEFGTLGPDGLIGFGDFLAMLGQVGPCP